jgi:phosphoglucosamine mutase
MAKYFGTDGIRGRFNLELTPALAFKVGQSLKTVLGIDRVVIGIDTRESSTELMYSVTAGAQSAGVDVMLAGVVPTPLISHYSKTKEIAGVMITASHNPYQDNGIKVFYKGNKLLEKQELAIEDYIDQFGDLEFVSKGDLVGGEEVVELYADLIDSIEVDPTDIKLGYDSANGANYLLAKALFDQFVPNSKQIGNNPTGKNINDGVGSTHLEHIIDFVQKEKMDLGFSFDGDGDRILVVDQDGTVFDGDKIIYILATYLKEQGLLKKDTVVLTKMSNLGIIKAFERQGIDVVLTDVGDKYVLDQINQSGYSIGGENSGHIILRDYLNTGDGLLVGIYLLKVLSETGKTLQELTSDIKMWPQKLVNIRSYNKEVLQDERVVKVIEEVKEELKENGKVLVRASGTEPLLRVTLSCETEEALENYMDKIVSMITLVKEEV